jgi:hypothetical protein
MRTRFLLSSLLFGVTIVASPTLSTSAEQPIVMAQVRWQALTPSNSGFTVLMPGKPTEKSQTIDTVFGQMTLHTFTTSLAQGRGNYTVSYVELPEEMATIAPPDVLLETLSNAFSKNDRLKLLNQENLQIEQYPGRELTFEDANQNIVRHRTYLVKRHMYQMAVETPQARETDLSKDVANFFNSFKLKKN